MARFDGLRGLRLELRLSIMALKCEEVIDDGSLTVVKSEVR